MAKKRVVVHAECPACACGDISFIPPEKMKEKFIGNPKEVDILCPTCGTKIFRIGKSWSSHTLF